MSEPSWDDLHRRPLPAPPPDNDFDAVCARIFASGDGRTLLAMLRKRYFDSFASPLADERALRVRAAQQQFVRDFEAACERGLSATAKRKTT